MDDIGDSILPARDFVAHTDLACFESDPRTHDAVPRCLEIISEASRHVSPEAEARHPEPPWKQIADASPRGAAMRCAEARAASASTGIAPRRSAMGSSRPSAMFASVSVGSAPPRP